MKSTQFGNYARFYDLLYRDKNYSGESQYINSLISKFCKKSKEDISVLDLACGTGRHLIELSNLGYERLNGSDISSSMIEMAKENMVRFNKNISLHNYSFQESDRIGSSGFDIVLSMFSAVNYITSFEDQVKSLQNVNHLLKEDGLFIFDYWNGNAVVRDYSPIKVLRKEDGDREIIRISRTRIDRIEQSAEVSFQCIYLEEDKKIDDFEEVHHLHYYFISEMRSLLKMSQFKIIQESPFMEERELDPFDWNISVVAQKKK
ncbi:MAG: class I SAM-dependent DNA methyltransferase [Chitinophagales bacterium]